jgi:hypothetical protein
LRSYISMKWSVRLYVKRLWDQQGTCLGSPVQEVS